MKRFVIAFTLLIIIATACFSITCVAQNAIEETKTALLSCAEKEKNISLDVIKVRTALNTWEKNKRILYMFMFHDNFSELEKKMIALRYLAAFPEYREISRIISESAMMLDNLKDDFRVNLENIL